MKWPVAMVFGLILAGCSSRPEPLPENEPLLTETTLTRHDGAAISLEELQSLRPSALATAETIARIDRQLLEPWAEHREAAIILQTLRAQHPSETRLAETLWESAEPHQRDAGRALFREYGCFSNQYVTNGFGPRARPASLESYVEMVLAGHTDADPGARLHAAWRRFAPLVVDRTSAYLASSWDIELDYVAPVRVGLADSLLGPFERVAILEGSQTGFYGPDESYEGYTASVILLDLLAPGPASPVSTVVEELSAVAAGTGARLSFKVRDGKPERDEDFDLEFLAAALAGLQGGQAGVESLPQGVASFEVTFCYLVDRAEARASLTLARVSGGWELRNFEYEPAAARLVGSHARLDLMPTIRTLLSRTRAR